MFKDFGRIDNRTAAENMIVRYIWSRRCGLDSQNVYHGSALLDLLSYLKTLYSVFPLSHLPSSPPIR